MAHWPAAVLTVFLPTTAMAVDGPDLLADPFQLSLGTYILDTDTQVSLGGDDGSAGTDVNWEQVFGGGDADRFRVDGAWRFGRHHRLRALWFDFSRRRTQFIDLDIDWGDESFPAETTVDSEMSFTILELAYEFAFVRREGLEVAATAGLHNTDFTASLSAIVPAGGGSGTREASDTAEYEYPLPVFGLRGLWHVGGDFWLDASAQYFELEYKEYDGSIIDGRLTLQWQPRRWIGIGLGYNRFEVKLDINDEDSRDEIDWVYDGPMLFYSVSF